MIIRCAIVDDEPLAITVLKGLLEKIPNIEVVAKFNDALSVLDFLAENDQIIDFLFLDIEMPNLSGIDFLKSIPNPPLVIITTANKNYAIEGFELNVVDYLLKPITLERLVKSINRVKERVAEQHVSKKQTSEYLFLKENKKMVKVLMDDVLYLESFKDYIKVITKDKMVVTKQKLSWFEENLSADDFIRVHKSFIVAKKHVEAFTSSSVEIGFTEIPIGRSFKEDTLKQLGELSE